MAKKKKTRIQSDLNRFFKKEVWNEDTQEWDEIST